MSIGNIVLSGGVRQALGSLQDTSSAAEATQLRLATGKKVNSALDNPTNFFTASGLNDRANDLSRLLDSIGQSTKTLEAADKGIQAVRKLVETAQATLRQAQQSTSTTPKVTSATSLTGSTLLTSAGAGGFAAGDTITVNGQTVATVAAASTVQDVVDGINGNTTLNPAGSPAKVKASLNGAGNLVVESLDGTALAVSGSAAAKVQDLFGAGTPITASASTNTVRQSLSAQYDGLRTQIDQLSRDSGYNGVNLLAGDSLKVVFNETGSSSQTVSGVKFDSKGLGISLAANNLQSDTDIRTRSENSTRRQPLCARRPRRSARTSRSCRTVRTSRSR